MPALNRQSIFCCVVAHQSGDRFLARFKCYMIYNLVIGFAYAVEAAKYHLASVVSVCFFLDAVVLAWMASLTSKSSASRKLQCLASVSFATSVLSLIAVVAFQSWLFWVGGFTAGISVALKEQGPVAWAFAVFVCISKALTLLVANSFRLWLSQKHPDSQQGVSMTASVRTPALATMQESSADSLVGSVP